MLRSAAKSLLKLCFVTAIVGGGTGGIWYYGHRQSAAYQIQQLETARKQLEEEKRQLQTVVQRLSDEKRVAEVLVTDQRTIDGELRTTLLFVEVAKDGSNLPPRTFVIKGASAHIDAMVIKFDRDFVAQDDPLRGHSIALFRRIFGDTQSPDSAFRIDEPGEIPGIYRGDSKDPARLAAFEKELWQNFWRLAEDKDYRLSKGIRVANGQGIWGPFLPDKLYTITLDSDGGLNLTSEPMKGIYREAMKASVRAETRSRVNDE